MKNIMEHTRRMYAMGVIGDTLTDLGVGQADALFDRLMEEALREWHNGRTAPERAARKVYQASR